MAGFEEGIGRINEKNFRKLSIFRSLYKPLLIEICNKFSHSCDFPRRSTVI